MKNFSFARILQVHAYANKMIKTKFFLSAHNIKCTEKRRVILGTYFFF